MGILSDEIIIAKIEEQIGCHFKQRDAIEYHDNDAHYVVDSESNNITGLRLPRRARIVPPEVFELIHLTHLDLSLVKILELPSDLIKLKKLQQLNLYDTEIKYLPQEIGELLELVKINLARTPLAELPESICKLKKLEKLYLWATRIRKLPEDIGELQCLRRLDLSECRLKTLPESIVNLQIDFEDDARFDCIKITDISIDDKKIYDCVKQGKKSALAAYFQNRKIHSERIAFESRLVLLGNGGAGKTCVMHALLNNFFSPTQEKTEGISISDWIIDDDCERGCVHILDFGGQEIYRPLYSLFLTEADIYLIVLNGRSDEKPDDWLEFIRFFARGTPVIIVINRIDENPQAQINERYIRRKYKDIDIVDIIRCSCKDYAIPEGNIDILRRSIIETIHKRGLRLEYNENRERVRKLLDRNKNEYTESDLYEMCKKCGISSQTEQTEIVKEIFKYGILIRPKGSYHSFINPNWFSGIVSRIYGYAETKTDEQSFSREEIIHHLTSSCPEITSDTIDNLIAALKHSIICITADNRIVVPSVLPVYVENDEIDHVDQNKYIIEYNMASDLFFHYLLAWLYEKKTSEYMWCNAIQITYNETVAFIEQAENKIEITISKEYASENRDKCIDFLLSTIQCVHMEQKISNVRFNVLIPRDQEENRLVQIINNYGGQVNAPRDSATVVASMDTITDIDEKELTMLLGVLDNQISSIYEKDRELFKSALEEIKTMLEQKKPEKSRVEKAVAILQGFKEIAVVGEFIEKVVVFFNRFL